MSSLMDHDEEGQAPFILFDEWSKSMNWLDDRYCSYEINFEWKK